MSIKIEYKTFSIDSIELSHLDYVSLKNQSKKGYLDLNNHLPNISFYAAEKDRFRGFGIAIALLLVGLILSAVFKELIDGNALFAILFGAPAWFGFFGVFIFGLGLVFSLISFLSYSTQRQVLVKKMKKAFNESVDYEDYCRIRKIKYNPTEVGEVLNEIYNK